MTAVFPMSDVSAVAHVIQLAVAPVFLLTGIGAMLGVMTNRLSRVIDRARALEARLDGAGSQQVAVLQADLDVLVRRAALVGSAITLCTTTALLICTVIAVLFLSAFIPFDTSIPTCIGWLRSVVGVVGLPGASFLAVRFELVLCQPFGFCRFGLHRGVSCCPSVSETQAHSDCRGIVCFSCNAAPHSTSETGEATLIALFFERDIQGACDLWAKRGRPSAPARR